jgi:predicted N-formylglutamate amidohydrolase
VQPFWYSRQGFPDLLEIPLQGWIDAQYRREHGWENWPVYHEYLKGVVDEVAASGRCWSLCQHDWTSIMYDEPLHWTRKLLEYAAERLVILTHFEFYEQLRRRREPTP